MTWFVTSLVVLVLAVLAILFLGRYYRKAGQDVALIRTGAGGRRVVLDGGVVALPFLHRIAEVNMRTSRLEIERLGPRSIITRDRLRVDVGAEFHVRVAADAAGVATAAQALGAKTFRAEDLAETLEGKLVDALLSVASGYTMDELQDDRGRYVAEVAEALARNLAFNGLVLESVSLTRLDQTPFQALDENNAFNAIGMRRLSEIIADNRKRRAEIEADAEVAVRQSQLEATKRRLTIDQEEAEAGITQRRLLDTARAASDADVAEAQAAADRRREEARITRERETGLAEIARDRELRRERLEAELAAETRRSENAVALAARRVEEAEAEARARLAEVGPAEAEEGLETARRRAAAERDKVLALIRAAERAETDDRRVRSEADTVLAMAEAEAEATRRRAAAAREEALARAEGVAALVAADNAQSDALMRLRLDERRLEALPKVVERMMKPTEKIESIRINHVSGLGWGGGPGPDADGRPAAPRSAVNEVIDGVLGLALQMPAMRRLGEEVGLNVTSGLDGLTAALDPSPPPPPRDAPPDTPRAEA